MKKRVVATSSPTDETSFEAHRDSRNGAFREPLAPRRTMEFSVKSSLCTVRKACGL
jgi:hypothetical protein